MSSKKQMIWLTPPLYQSKYERIESRNHECGYCHGTGGFWGERNSPSESEWKECPVCEGGPQREDRRKAQARVGKRK